ncbi:MAG: transposase IS200-family protein [Candidatus Angelobacter sp.]|nr:transposase IS200-family protein [Candidatus Angelobacter sp.]
MPHPCAARVGILILVLRRRLYTAQVPKGLKRYYGQQHLHFITFSCYRRLPILGTARRRTAFLKTLEEVRISYGFKVVGYVVMPEHVHLLLSEPGRADPSTVMQVLKQRFARRIRPRKNQNIAAGQGELWPLTRAPEKAVWQRRFYDFNVWSPAKRTEKLRYMHNNPSNVVW